MISFLTNEQTPRKLEDALKNLRQNGEKVNHVKKDKFLVVLGVSFLTGICILLVLLVFSMLFLY